MEFCARQTEQGAMHLRRAIAENDDAMAEQQRFVAGRAQEKPGDAPAFRRQNWRSCANCGTARAAHAAPLPAPADSTGKPLTPDFQRRLPHLEGLAGCT